MLKKVVLKLVERFKDTNRSITADNFFISVPLAEKLLVQGLFLVGTLKKNKPEIPPEFLNTKVIKSQIDKIFF